MTDNNRGDLVTIGHVGQYVVHSARNVFELVINTFIHRQTLYREEKKYSTVKQFQ